MHEDEDLASPSTKVVLVDLLKRLTELRGDQKVWFRRKCALTRFVAGAQAHQRVIVHGEWQGSCRHSPAVLVYDTNKREMQAWIPIGDDDTLDIVSPHYFHSGIPHTGIAREVLSESSSNSTI
jgi:hypothetical protein